MRKPLWLVWWALKRRAKQYAPLVVGDYFEIDFKWVNKRLQPNYFTYDPTDLRRALCGLAHEIGHCIAVETYSKRKLCRLGKAEVVPVEWFQGRHKQGQEYYEDERRAWQEGAKILEELGFKDWAYFGRESSSCLATYEVVL